MPYPKSWQCYINLLENIYWQGDHYLTRASAPTMTILYIVIFFLACDYFWKNDNKAGAKILEEWTSDLGIVDDVNQGRNNGTVWWHEIQSLGILGRKDTQFTCEVRCFGKSCAEKTSTTCGKCSRLGKAKGDLVSSEESSVEQEEARLSVEVEDKADFADDWAWVSRDPGTVPSSKKKKKTQKNTLFSVHWFKKLFHQDPKCI